MTLWTVAHQSPLSMGFSRKEYCSGLPSPSAGDLPDPGIELGYLILQADCLPSESPGKNLSKSTFNINISSKILFEAIYAYSITNLKILASTHLCLWLVAKSCLTLCDPMNCSPPGSSVRRVFQAIILDKFVPFPLPGDKGMSNHFSILALRTP